MSIGSANDAPSARVIRQFGRASSYGTRIAGPCFAVIGRVHCGDRRPLVVLWCCVKLYQSSKLLINYSVSLSVGRLKPKLIRRSWKQCLRVAPCVERHSHRAG